MTNATLEHGNITVSDPDQTADRLCKLFDWRIRWQGEGIYGGPKQLVVTLDDGTKRPLNAIMKNVMAMWERVLAEMSL